MPPAPARAVRRRRQRLRDLGALDRPSARAGVGDGARHPRTARRDDGRPRLLRGPAQGRRRDRARARRRRAVSDPRARHPAVLALALRRPEEVPHHGRAQPTRPSTIRSSCSPRSSIDAGALTQEQADAIRDEAKETVRAAAEQALAAARPDPCRRDACTSSAPLPVIDDPGEPEIDADAEVVTFGEAIRLHAARADGARRTHPRVRRRRRRRRPRRDRRSAGQGRRVRHHVRVAARVRRRALLQHTARGSEHHRPRGRPSRRADCGRAPRSSSSTTCGRR